MAKKTVEFDAHKTVKQPTEVAFETKGGKKVDFVADKPTTWIMHDLGTRSASDSMN